MVGVDVYTPLLIFATLGIFSTMLLPALVIPWKLFSRYFALGVLLAFLAWYATSLDGALIRYLSAIGLFTFIVALPVRALRVSSETLLHPRPLRVAASLVVVSALLISGAETFKVLNEKRHIPSYFSGTRSIYLPRVLLPRCEISIWEYSALGEIPTIVLPEAAPGWQATPIEASTLTPTQHDHWLNGIGCSSVDPVARDAIIEALLTPGSTYLPGPSSGFVHVPSRRLLFRVHAL